jgi:general secretion pathway protein G
MPDPQNFNRKAREISRILPTNLASRGIGFRARLPPQAYSRFMKISPTPSIRRRKGFTLLEMVIVLGIIAMIMGGAIFAMRGIGAQAKPTQAKADINAFLSALSMYKVNKGKYPTTQEGLKRLMETKAMTKITQDPWERDYIYRFPGKIDKNEPEIISLGEDGQENTEDDINSQKL